MALDSVDVVAPLENLTASALVASEGASLLVGGLNGKRLGIDAVEGAAGEAVGLNEGVEVLGSAPLLEFGWLAEREEFAAGVKEVKLDLGGVSVLGCGEKVLEEGLKFVDWFEEDPDCARDWKRGVALVFSVPLILASSFLSRMFLKMLEVWEPGEAAKRDGYVTASSPRAFLPLSAVPCAVSLAGSSSADRLLFLLIVCGT